MKNLVLIGMPGVGKSTVGVIAAKKLGYEFIDTDLCIQKQEGALLREIIDDKGIDGFLEIENQVNRDLEAERAVIAPGGSVVYCQEAMEHFRENGIVIYLRISFAEIERRLHNIKGRGVVLRDGQKLRDLYDERVPLFEAYAHAVVEEDGLGIEETIDQVLEKFHQVQQ